MPRCSARAVADGTASDAWLSLHASSRGAGRVRVLGSVSFVMLHTPDGVAHGIRATEYKPRFPKRGPNALPRRRLHRRSARPAADVTAAARPAGVARLIPRCRSSARSWLRDVRHAPNAGRTRSWHQSHAIQAPISKPKAAKRRADGVCLAASHALSWTSHGRRLALALHVCDPAVPVECEFLAA